MTSPGRTAPNVAIIDDHAAIREAISMWCAQANPPIVVHSVYESPKQFVADRASRATRRVDVVVLDLQFDQQSPDLAALDWLCHTGFKVVVYSQHDNSGLVLDCLDRGAAGYLSKSEGRAHLTRAIHAAFSNESFISPTMARAINEDDAVRRPALSEREREVLLAWFKTESKELVAGSLGISVTTVSTHLSRVRAKYANSGRPAPTKAALVARAIQDGLVSPDEL